MVNPKLSVVVEDDLSDITTHWPVPSSDDGSITSGESRAISPPASPVYNMTPSPLHTPGTTTPRPLRRSSMGPHGGSPPQTPHRLSLHHCRKNSIPMLQAELESLRTLQSSPTSSPATFTSLVEQELAARVRTDDIISHMKPGPQRSKIEADEVQRRLQWAETMLLQHPSECASYYNARAGTSPISEALEAVKVPKLFTYEMGPSAGITLV